MVAESLSRGRSLIVVVKYCILLAYLEWRICAGEES
jgi:hypothetical protein